MKKFFITGAILGALALQGQTAPPGVLWQKSYGGSKTDVARSMEKTADGGFIIAGYSNSEDGDVVGNHSSDYDFWVVKLSSDGSKEWAKTFGGSGDDRAFSVKQTSDGGYIVAGYTNSPSNSGDIVTNHGGDEGGYDFLVIKLNNDGSKDWAKTYGGLKDDYAYSIVQTADHGYVIAGASSSSEILENSLVGYFGGLDIWLVKTDVDGNEEFNVNDGGPGDDIAYTVVDDGNDQYFVIGAAQPDSSGQGVIGGHGGSEYFAVDFANMGNDFVLPISEMAFGGTGNDYGKDMLKIGNDGGYIFTGFSDSDNQNVTDHIGGNDFWTVKIASNGDREWLKSYGGTGDDQAYSIRQTSDGGYIIGGFSNSNDMDVSGNHGGYDYWIVKTDSAGAIEWQKSIGGTGDDYGYVVRQTDDGYVVAGSSASSGQSDNYTISNKGGQDFWIVKLGTKALDVDEASPLNSEVVAYPNPFIEQLRFRVNLKSSTNAKITISSMAGQNLYQANKHLNAGQNEIDLSSAFNGKSAGLYVVTIIGDNGLQVSNKVVKIK